MTRRLASRRRFLRQAGAAGLAVAGVAVAGCAGSSADETATPAYGDWFEDVDSFDGTVDRTGREETEVRVGAEGNGGYLAFDPAAVRVDAGTTVRWVWTGRGGVHNVAARDGTYRSELAEREGFEFTHEFGEAGTSLYLCDPHRSQGMRGAVQVV